MREAVRSRAIAIALLCAAPLASACDVSPDAVDRGLVFVRIENGSTELARARLSDGATEWLTRTPGRDEVWPYWSEPADRVVFQATLRGESASDLYLWNPADGAEEPLLRTPGRDERWPGWSPDGTGVVTAWRELGAAGVDIVDLATRRATPLARTGPVDFFLRPNFAPDGARLVAQRRVPGTRDSKLWILAPGAEPLPLTRDASFSDMKAWFTRDGARVVYSRRPAGGGPHHVASVDGDGGEATVLIDAPGGHSARPSPTRDEMAFVSDRGDSMDLYVADLDGGGLRALTATPGRNEFAPRWSPDGNHIVVTTDTTDDVEPRPLDRFGFHDPRVMVVDRSGRVHFEAPGFMPDWLPAWR